MITEIKELRKNIRIYNNPPNDKAFAKAEQHLIKVHKSYGTIDIPTIKNIIK
tara:strand:+ start:685 stop:840 length:156 start_codon:yes stop_codon:yes gene_type:complete